MDIGLSMHNIAPKTTHVLAKKGSGTIQQYNEQGERQLPERIIVAESILLHACMNFSQDKY